MDSRGRPTGRAARAQPRVWHSPGRRYHPLFLWPDATDFHRPAGHSRRIPLQSAPVKRIQAAHPQGIKSKLMILKERDSLDGRLQQLEETLNSSSGLLRDRAARDIAFVKAGARGEDEAAYHIDFHLKSVPNWAVIHDLRLEWRGRVAQIDHLLIDRFLQINVVESKSFRSKIRYANGGWERINYNHWEGIPSPVDQNDRHILVLEQLIKDRQLTPKKLGFPVPPKYVNIVLVQPTCSIIGGYPADVRVHRMDSFVKKLRAELPIGMEVFKLISPETLQAFATQLLAFHTPARVPARVPAPIPTHPNSPPLPNPTMAPAPKPMPAPVSQPAAARVQAASAAPQTCESCNGPLTGAEAEYCQKFPRKFGGKLLCRGCQKPAGRTRMQDQPTPAPIPPPVSPPVSAAPAPTAPVIAARCAGCSEGVEHKVVAFCRFNSKRFGGRVLCRNCQGTLK